ncbi:MAG TPA: zf-TFIIB domain-containing protein [Burkholderiales bacterium]|nr:zf-TFIIB domain-containing protein [Burkholderiales bacterium]
MKCPVCSEPDLLMSERQGIEIDYCPKCRGVWLDRGELDKLIDRAAAPQAAPSPQHPAAEHRSREYRDDDSYRRGHKRKRGGFLGEIFDFD